MNAYMKSSVHNPKHSRFPDFAADRTANFRSLDNDQTPTTAGPAVVVASENSSSLNGFRNCGGGYVAFNVLNYSRRERRELRRQLESELEQVRTFASEIQSRDSMMVGPEMEKLAGAMMKKCGQMLSKLMKQKKSVWFNSPVDVVGMGLHDYFQIVKNPMDLGTVKSKLNKGMYASPVEFADDVRLTFNNALIYNPVGHEVHKLAGQYLHLFDNLFEQAYYKYQQQRVLMGRGEQQASLSGNNRQDKYNNSTSGAAMRYEPPMLKVPTPPPVQAAVPSAQATLLPHIQASRSQLPSQDQQCPKGRVMEGKQPKPRAKDLNKRQMTYEEKQSLGLAIESLPGDKMLQVLQIVSKRNAHPMQNGDDEIELDIEMIDTDTLWELDRFVNNCKKASTKMRRQDEARPFEPNLEPATSPLIPSAGNRFDVSDAVSAKRSKKLDAADEDVDIGDEMPPAHYPSLEIKKNVGDASSSSSLGSDSSSSDDSGSSSGSDSDDAKSHG